MLLNNEYMKKIIFFTGTLFIFGCYSGKRGPATREDRFSYHYIYAIDSTSSAYESPEDPGTFHKNYDTVKIAVKNINKIRHGYIVDYGKVSYKIVKTK